MCNAQQVLLNAKVFNQRALNILINSDDTDTIQLRSGLRELDSAIYLDPSYFVAYSNKVNFLIKLNRRQEAVSVLIFLINKKYNIAESLMTEGFLYEHLNDNSQAIEHYKLAAKDYNDRLSKDSSIISNQLNLVFCELMIDNNKQNALTKITLLENRFPQNKSVSDMRELIDSFNRQDYINQF